MMLKITLLALCAAVSTASDLDELNDCSRDCFEEQVGPSPCNSIEDLECLCGSEEYISNAIDCAAGSCDLGDSLSARVWIEDICEDLGIIL